MLPGQTAAVSATIIHLFLSVVNAYFSVFGAVSPDFFVRILRDRGNTVRFPLRFGMLNFLKKMIVYRAGPGPKS